MAKIFEKKTMNGSRVTANIAGIESNANTRSVNSIITNTTIRGVKNNLLFWRMAKLPPEY